MYDHSYGVIRSYKISVLGKLVFWGVFHVELVQSKAKETQEIIWEFNRSKKSEEVTQSTISSFIIHEDIRDEVGDAGFHFICKIRIIPILIHILY